MSGISRSETTAMALGTLAYFAIVIFAAPVNRPSLISGGVVAFSLAYALSRQLGPVDRAGREPVAVMLVAILILVMPVAFGAPPRGPGFAASAVGVLTAQGIWAVRRYPADARRQRPRALIADVRWGVRRGMAFAVVFSLYVLAVFAIGSIALRQTLFADTRLSLIVCAYFGGGVIGGVVAGLLRPLSHQPLGAMLMGIIVAFPIYECIALIMPLIDAELGSMSFGGQLAIGAICAIMAGPPAALSMRGWASTSRRVDAARGR